VATQAVSLVIPSALAPHPGGGFWLARAVVSALKQSRPPAEVVVALDPGARLPPEVAALSPCVRAVNGEAPGHQAASNAAVRSAGYPLVAFLEDDDTWEPWHLESAWEAMCRHAADFVSSSQRLVDADGAPRGVFDFPTASGWLLDRLVWVRLGGFDVSYRIHHDNDFLGKLNRAGVRRLHLTEDAPSPPRRKDVQRLACFSWVAPSRGRLVPSVNRSVHGGSVLAGVKRDQEKAQRSRAEYARLRSEYGDIPW